MLRCFKSDRDEIWHDCSSSKYASIDGIGLSIWRHTFTMAAMTSFYAEKCCHAVSGAVPVQLVAIIKYPKVMCRYLYIGHAYV